MAQYGALPRYLARLVTQAIGRAIQWYVRRGFPLSNIIESLRLRSFRSTTETITNLTQYFRSQVNAARGITRLNDNTIIAVSNIPRESNQATKVRVRYKIVIDDDSFDREAFYDLTADCDDGMTKEQLMQCIYDSADNFLNYYNYDVQRYHIDIHELSGI